MAGAFPSLRSWAGPVLALGGVAVTTALCEALTPCLSPASLALLFIVPVLVAAAQQGLGSGLVAAAAAALAFNYFLVAPQFTLRIASPDNLATMLVLLVVAVVTSKLVAQLRAAGDAAQARAADETMLAELGHALSAVADDDGILARLRSFLADALGAEVGICPAQEAAAAALAGHPLDRAAAAWALTNAEPAGRGSGVIAGADQLFVPVVVGERVAALLGLTREGSAAPVPAGRMGLLRRAVGIAEQALARLHLTAEQAAADAARQRGELGTALLSSVGHDLRTPLTVILAEARALAVCRPEWREPVAIAGAAARLSRRIDNLLGMARVEAGAVSVVIEPVDLADAVASALDDLGPSLAARRATVRLPDDLPLVPADPGLLHHVLLNLLDNAGKFAGPDGPVEITGVADGAGVRLVVADRGPGLPPGHENAVFERFRRFAGSDRTGGSGLGLAIARAFSGAFGAAIDAANRAGGGACFTLSWPAAG